MKEIMGQFGAVIVSCIVLACVLGFLGSMRSGAVVNSIGRIYEGVVEAGQEESASSAGTDELAAYEARSGILVEMKPGAWIETKEAIPVTDFLQITDINGNDVACNVVSVTDERGNAYYATETIHGQTLQFENAGIYEMRIEGLDQNGTWQSAYFKIPVQTKGEN